MKKVQPCITCTYTSYLYIILVCSIIVTHTHTHTHTHSHSHTLTANLLAVLPISQGREIKVQEGACVVGESPQSTAQPEDGDGYLKGGERWRESGEYIHVRCPMAQGVYALPPMKVLLAIAIALFISSNTHNVHTYMY